MIGLNMQPLDMDGQSTGMSSNHHHMGHYRIVKNNPIGSQAGSF